MTLLAGKRKGEGRGLRLRGGNRGLAVAVLLLLSVGAVILSAGAAHGAEASLPGVKLDLDDLKGPQQISSVVQIVLLLTVLTLAPAIVILMTSFTRIAVVLAFLRQAIGTQQSPPSQVLIGLALFLTFFIMQPTWQKINQDALVPYQAKEITGEEFMRRGIEPLRDFMLRNTRQADLALFVSLSQQEKPKNAEAVPIMTLVPAFVISELRTAFQIGFMLYIPFIVLDMVVSSILLSMGMMMLPPVMISLPFKLMLFVLVDGWNLLVGSLVKSFH